MGSTDIDTSGAEAGGTRLCKDRDTKYAWGIDRYYVNCHLSAMMIVVHIHHMFSWKKIRTNLKQQAKKVARAGFFKEKNLGDIEVLFPRQIRAM